MSAEAVRQAGSCVRSDAEACWTEALVSVAEACRIVVLNLAHTGCRKEVWWTSGL